MRRLLPLSLSLLIALTSFALGQNKYDKVEITTIPVGHGIYMLQGAGGNIGVSAGEDGVFMIDDQYSPLTPKIIAAISKISDKPIRFVINTHWHGDHTGGNENLGKTDVIIVAHDNVYKRLSSDQFIKAFDRHVPAAPKAALPVISFNDKVTFHLNGLHIQARHFAPAHTDGDSMIFFKGTNIVHTGDIFFNHMYPFIDTSSGGTIYGMIEATATLLTQVDEETKIIPGHGPLANKADLQAYHDMLVRVVEILTPLAQKNIPIEKATEMKPLKELDDKWGGGFFKADMFLGTVYQTIIDHGKTD
ncbi:MBL-fold metallo-hydrolase superfamily [hydrothermal vent metagenome]|uniref:MBL-fold metallo-hydrolase superfamily n=1 Tax=hydrothermal vent metagenome TaxID=652676 RepID=A0A3B0REZ4_9ZZZZ